MARWRVKEAEGQQARVNRGSPTPGSGRLAPLMPAETALQSDGWALVDGLFNAELVSNVRREIKQLEAQVRFCRYPGFPLPAT
jgi:hypothetical protein